MGIKLSKGMTGKELFEHKKNLFEDAEDAVDEYKREENVDIDHDAFDDEEELPDLWLINLSNSQKYLIIL